MVLPGLLWVVLATIPATAQVVQDNPPELEDVGIDEHLGDKIPLDLVFTNEQGEHVKLGSYFKEGRPVILTMVYYNCPMLCNLVMNGQAEAVKPLDWEPGDEYQMISVSINPRETHELAAAKKANYLKQLDHPGAAPGWAFLVGEESQSKALAAALGFKYRYDEERQEYAHTAAMFVLTDDGTISRYLYGLSHKPRDVRLAVVEASKGQVGNSIDQLILYCYHYDPDQRGYVVLATSVMKLGGLVTVLILGTFLALLWLRERSRRRKRRLQGASSAGGDTQRQSENVRSGQ